MKWNKVTDKLPKNDNIVLVWVESKENNLWKHYETGHYEKGKWYLRRGYNPAIETVTQWIKIPKKE